MIIIIGAGINGLALGYELQKRGISYQILEATQRVGGCINSQKVDDYWLELGPNSLLCNSEVDQVIDEVGLRDQVVEANEISNRRYIFKKGRYQKLPAKPQQLLFSSFFSFKTKLAVFREFRNKSKGTENETLSSFFGRRFSQEVVDYPLNTFVAGIYAGDPDQLLLRKAFPVLKRYEDEHGSILRGFIKNKTGERRKSVSFREGISQLPRTMAKQLNIRLQTPVQRITKGRNGKFSLQIAGNETLEAEKVVLGVPTSAAANLLHDCKPTFAEALRQVNYPPMAAVYSAFKKSSVKHPLDGFGGLHPQKEGLFAAGSIWNSSTFAGKCPEDEVLLTTFIGGELYRERALMPESEVLDRVTKELKKLHQITDEPTFQHFYRWEKAIPQYDKNILSAHAEAEKVESEGLFVATNWKDGISLADAFKKAKELKEKLMR